jgi:hypothetical protein
MVDNVVDNPVDNLSERPTKLCEGIFHKTRHVLALHDSLHREFSFVLERIFLNFRGILDGFLGDFRLVFLGIFSILLRYKGQV